MIHPLPKSNPLYPKIESASPDFLRRELVRIGGISAEKQFVVALTIQAIADRRDGPNAIPSLADEILVQHSHKIERFGEKAFPLSEKQIDAILRDCCR